MSNLIKIYNNKKLSQMNNEAITSTFLNLPLKSKLNMFNKNNLLVPAIQ